jgi:hypothetical protein
MTGRLRALIVEHGLATPRGGADLVFGRTASDPFTPVTARSRALSAWGWQRVPNPKSDGPRMSCVRFYRWRTDTRPGTSKAPMRSGPSKYRHGDSNPGFRRERAAS